MVSRLSIAALLLFATVTLRASTPTFWEVSTESEFLRGEIENLSIDSFGRLTLGPTAAPVPAGLARPGERCVPERPAAGTSLEGPDFAYSR